MGAITGTPKKITIDGITVDVFADVNISLTPTKFKHDGIATTGRTLQKFTKQVKKMEGISIATSADKIEALAEKADSIASKTYSVEFADGTVYRASGQFDFEKWESEDSKATINFIPDDDWTPFPAQ